MAPLAIAPWLSLPMVITAGQPLPRSHRSTLEPCGRPAEHLQASCRHRQQIGQVHPVVGGFEEEGPAEAVTAADPYLVLPGHRQPNAASRRWCDSQDPGRFAGVTRRTVRSARTVTRFIKSQRSAHGRESRYPGPQQPFLTPILLESNDALARNDRVTGSTAASPECHRFSSRFRKLWVLTDGPQKTFPQTPMRASTEWHLTPRGWARGTETSQDQTIWRDPPSSRVKTVLYEQGPPTLDGPPRHSSTVIWETTDLEQLNRLENRYGLPPQAL